MSNNIIDLSNNGKFNIHNDTGIIKDLNNIEENIYNDYSIKYFNNLFEGIIFSNCNENVTGNYNLTSAGNIEFISDIPKIESLNEMFWEFTGDILLKANNIFITFGKKIWHFNIFIRNDGGIVTLIRELPRISVGNIKISCKGDGITGTDTQAEFNLLKTSGSNSNGNLLQELPGSNGETLKVIWFDSINPINSMIRFNLNADYSSIYADERTSTNIILYFA